MVVLLLSGISSQVIFLAVLAGCALTLLTAYLAIRIAERAGLIDVPGSSDRKRHLRPTPLAGGIAIALSLIPLTLIFRTVWDRQIAVMLLGAAVILIFGLWDDKVDLHPRTKLLGQLLACSLINLSCWYG